MKNPFRKRWEVYMIDRKTGQEVPHVASLKSMFRFWTYQSADALRCYGSYYSSLTEYHVRRLP